ncbi:MULTISPECIES: DUF3332 family protein [unclassified Photobacterium]|uniref:DUF3332 family protein n=1 Tax=unclassified Photobacterium TaxID=2628852 RepID=UPI001B8B3DBC|nr:MULTISPECIES: DUF3332 family protein [unclassified Photobacterium]MDO6707259.1 DUF3332 family protein [Photobacterium sp. 1_MG-2023]QUJ69905.1 DUF3332 family protein [Photobacterium sp. GJ3]
MKKMIFVAVSLASLLTGCAGQMAATQATMKLNMDAVDNRYARGGLTILMSPVYAVTTVADYMVLNPIEFWTGENVVTQKPSIYDAKGEDYIKINDQLDQEYKTAPIKPLN